MIRKYLSFAILTVLATARLGAAAAAAPKEVRKMPELLVDNSAVGEAGRPSVTSYADMLEPVQKSVVTIDAIKKLNVPPQLQKMLNRGGPGLTEEGLGSGVIISTDGYILTNNHVVEDADELKVTFSDLRELKATLIGKDPTTDLAIIKVEATELKPITLADSDKLRVGDVVFAIGNPLGVGQTVTMGIVSAKGRNIGILHDVGGFEDFIQTDAAINMGNSGGALVDAKGRLVGINGAILSPSSGSIGIGFAVPVNLATNIMQGLIERGSVTRGWLGVDELKPVDAETAASLNLKNDTRGVVVGYVFPDSPAFKSGLKPYDVILSIDGRVIASENDLGLAVSQRAPGSVGELKYLRGAQEASAQVTFVEKPKLAQNELLAGVTTLPIDDDLRKAHRINSRITAGLVVTSVAPDSLYSGEFDIGSVILSINQVEIASMSEARAALDRSRVSPRSGGKVASMLVVPPKSGQSRIATVELK